MARKVVDDLQVIIPYKQLLSLLESSRRVESLDRKMELVLQQQAAMRLQFTELLEAFRELM